MKRKHSFIPVVIALIMVLTSCASTAQQSQSSAAPQPAQQATVAPAAPASEAPAAQSTPQSQPEPEKIKELSFATSVHYSDPKFGELYAEAFEKDMGIKMNLVNIPNDKWEEKISALLMSGDIPDVFRGSGQVNQYARQEFVVPLTDFIEQNEVIKALCEDSPEIYESFIVGGDVYALTLSHSQNMSAWIRKDILEQQGISMPTSMDELVEMWRAVKKLDLDNNPQTETIPLTMGNSPQAYETIAAAFGTRWTVFEKDGKYIDPVPTPEFKEFIDFMKGLYSEGLLDKEFAGQGYGQLRTKMYTGQAVSIVIWDNTGGGFFTNLEKNGIVGGEVVPIPVFRTDKGAFGQSYYPPNDNAYYISSEADDPKQVFDAFFEWNFTYPQGITIGARGVEGYNFTVENGVLTPTELGGVGFHGQHVPSHYKGFQYPFAFDPVTTRQLEQQEAIRADYANHKDAFDTNRPPYDYTPFWDVYASLSDTQGKTAELVYSYWIGELDYDKLMSDYNSFAKEIGLESIIVGLNK